MFSVDFLSHFLSLPIPHNTHSRTRTTQMLNMYILTERLQISSLSYILLTST